MKTYLRQIGKGQNSSAERRKSQKISDLQSIFHLLLRLPCSNQSQVIKIFLTHQNIISLKHAIKKIQKVVKSKKRKQNSTHSYHSYINPDTLLMKILAQFKSLPNYVDFCLSELKSLIAMHDLDWKDVFKYEFTSESEVESPSNFDEENDLYAYMYQITDNKQKKRLSYPSSVADVRHTSFRRFPFIYLELPSIEIAQSIIQRSMMLDVFIETISEAHSYDDLVKESDTVIFNKHNIEGLKVLFEVDPYNSHLTQKEAIDRIELVTESFHMKGKIDLKKPDQRFWVMERHIDPYTRQTDSSIVHTLLDVFFGIEIGRSKSCTRISQKDNFINKYDLKNRAYLGPTSTDNNLSFLMCNQGKVGASSLVFDPFVGSGSLLIPPSHYGAICYGGDLDPRVLHGFGVGRLNKQSKFYQANLEYCAEMTPKIMLNFEQYSLTKPTVIRMDCVNTNFRALEIFDAIICDPPYGFRAMTRTTSKQDKKKREKKRKNQSTENNPMEEEQVEQEEEESKVEDCQVDKQTENTVQEIVEQIEEKVAQLEVVEPAARLEHGEMISGEEHKVTFAQTITVSVEYIVNGLVGLANRVLVPGGRLVFLYPIEREVYNKSGISGLTTPNFRLIDYSENPLSEKKSRILVTLEKILPTSEFLLESKTSHKQ